MSKKQKKIDTICLLGNALFMNGLELRTEWNGDYTEFYVLNKRTNTKVKIPMARTDRFEGVFNNIISDRISNDKKQQEYYEFDQRRYKTVISTS